MTDQQPLLPRRITLPSLSLSLIPLLSHQAAHLGAKRRPVGDQGHVGLAEHEKVGQGAINGVQLGASAAGLLRVYHGLVEVQKAIAEQLSEVGGHLRAIHVSCHPATSIPKHHQPRRCRW